MPKNGEINGELNGQTTGKRRGVSILVAYHAHRLPGFFWSVEKERISY